tara:strand:- start:638 stop:1129 length:492 start_codon:yes stop_codon:yes gene_type:complete
VALLLHRFFVGVFDWINYRIVRFFTGVSVFMKFLIVLICFFSFLQSCTQESQNKLPGPSPSKVQFITPWQPGGGMGLYVRTGGEPYPIQENIRNFTMITKRQFSRKGVPASAITAASFLEVGDSKEDLQAIYVVKEGSQFKAFRGYFVPGFGGPVEWEQVDLW